MQGRPRRNLQLKEIITKIANEASLPRDVARKVFMATFQVIADELRAGRRVNTACMTFSKSVRHRRINVSLKKRFLKAVLG